MMKEPLPTPTQIRMKKIPRSFLYLPLRNPNAAALVAAALYNRNHSYRTRIYSFLLMAKLFLCVVFCFSTLVNNEDYYFPFLPFPPLPPFFPPPPVFAHFFTSLCSFGNGLSMGVIMVPALVLICRKEGKTILVKKREEEGEEGNILWVRLPFHIQSVHSNAYQSEYGWRSRRVQAS